MSVSRRFFLRSAASVTVGFAGLQMLTSKGVSATNTAKLTEGYGPLRKDPNGILDLPDGFSYKVISKVGDSMNDGFLVPGLPDGMASFPGPDGKTILVRNHEITADPTEIGPFGRQNERFANLPAQSCFDAGRGKTPSLGGTTNVLFDTETQEVLHQHLSLTGTVRNCAGGPTPWNTWITCEETVQRADDQYEQDHGWNFEVPAYISYQPVEPKPIKDMGRFNHEAVAVDPRTSIVYQTEDRGDGLIYRYIPNSPGNLLDGGTLQALAVRGRQSLDTRNWEHPNLIAVGEELAVEWIDLEEIDSPNDDLRFRGFDAGAARFARGEGMWTGEDGIYFACTSGGHAERGQIWKYIPSPAEGESDEDNQPGRLVLFCEPNDPGLVDNADNLCVAPWGDLMLCEDGSGEQYLVGINTQGEVYKFGYNAVSESEFAGVNFSPDGSTLFVNIQSDGLTLAITGPWQA